MLSVGALGLPSLVELWGIAYSKKEKFFDFMQENNDSRNSNQTLKCLDCGCLSGRGGTGNKDI